MNGPDNPHDIAYRLAHDSFESLSGKLRMVAKLTWPAVIAQLSMIVMEYIDAMMVGSLGPAPAASIGLVATTTWLFWGLGGAASTGFAVQLAHHIGAGDNDRARDTLRQGIITVAIVGVVLGAIGVCISRSLPVWLGGTPEIVQGSYEYFVIFAAAIPFWYLTYLSGAMLRCSGNMVVPGIVNAVMCVLDVVFNFFLIFPSRTVVLMGVPVEVPGADLGVAGASIGTCAAYVLGGVYMYRYLLFRSPRLKHPFRTGKVLRLSADTLRKARTISWPVALERVVMCGAQILITAIVAPLGTAAIAANSFAITAESLCYTPGFGIGEAATTLVGQCLGAGRKALALSFAHICVGAGVAVMGVLGGVMWLLAPEMMALFTPDATVCSLGTMALRTEAWAEPLFGAAIVSYGVCVGAGYTKIPAMLNFGTIWLVRVVLSALMAREYGLFGVWLAMCIELCVRGTLFLIVIARKRWIRNAGIVTSANIDAGLATERAQEPDSDPFNI